MFQKLVRPAAADPNKSKINTDDIVTTATNRNLYAGWGRVSMEPEERLEQMLYFLNTEAVPIIACQRFCDDEPEFGHFRVLLAADADVVTDASPKATLGASWSNFMA